MTDEPDATEIAGDQPGADPIPTDEVGLYGYLSKLRHFDRWDVAARLTRQEGRDCTDLVLRVIDEITNSEAITQSRAALKEALDAAIKSVQHVCDIREELAGALFDVEHAEGTDLFPHYLAKADLALRTAAAVNPTNHHQ